MLGGATPRHLRKLIKTYLTKMTSNLFENQVELIFDEERLIDYLLLELKRDHRKARGIRQLLDRKILKTHRCRTHHQEPYPGADTNLPWRGFLHP